jgi:hypothetical protein
MNDLAEISQRMQNLNAHLARWHRKLDNAFSERFDLENVAPGDFDRTFQEAVDHMEREIGSGPTEELFELLENLCDLYIVADSEQRVFIRQMVKINRDVLQDMSGYTWHAIEQLEASIDPKWLERALASISIEDMAIDYRDSLMDLAGLFLSAKQVGIDPLPYLRNTARLSSSDDPFRRGSTASVLASFDEERALELDRTWNEPD